MRCAVLVVGRRFLAYELVNRLKLDMTDRHSFSYRVASRYSGYASSAMIFTNPLIILYNAHNQAMPRTAKPITK